MDLQGQAASESNGHRHISGTGGQLQFIRGAYASEGGKSFVCMSSTYEREGVRRSFRPAHLDDVRGRERARLGAHCPAEQEPDEQDGGGCNGNLEPGAPFALPRRPEETERLQRLVRPLHLFQLG